MNNTAPTVHYFGTDLRSPGHYFFVVENELIRSSKMYFSDLEFNPEKYPKDGMQKGEHVFFQTGVHCVYFLAGSPIDKRLGCKSVFFINGNYTEDETLSILGEHEFFNTVVKMLRNEQ